MQTRKHKATLTPEVVRDAVRRREWINYQVRIRGYSQASLAREWGVDPSALRSAWIGGGYCDLQERTAGLLGVPVQALFPELYDPETGGRILLVRGSKRTTKARLDHVQNAQAV